MLNSLVAILGNGGGGAATDYESIATQTVGAGGASSITFSSIPSTYSHLQIRVTARDDRGVSFDNLNLRMNSDSGSNYSDHYLYADGSSVLSGGAASQTEMRAGTMPSAGVTSNVFGANVIDILDYANTNKYKTVRALTGVDVNGSGQFVFRSGSWQNTSAISSLTFFPGGGNFVQYSSFALYGIKA